MKRYGLYYESDQKICNSHNHFGGYASTIKTAKSYISSIKKREAEYAPRAFKILDIYAGMDEDIDPPCVYSE